jgi:hypothetical protein
VSSSDAVVDDVIALRRLLAAIVSHIDPLVWANLTMPVSSTEPPTSSSSSSTSSSSSSSPPSHYSTVQFLRAALARSQVMLGSWTNVRARLNSGDVVGSMATETDWSLLAFTGKCFILFACHYFSKLFQMGCFAPFFL